MQEYRSFTDVHTYLNGLMSETRSRREAYTLDRMQALMAFLGNPQDTYKVIHVAGTSGKSSTCYYLSALLGETGHAVGLGISPHVNEVNERVQINNQPLSESVFCREFSRFLREIEPSGIEPTYFELLVAFAFWEFAQAKVDYAVIEVGLGGLLDGTNVMSRPDKVCVITDIGYDHTSTLGKTLSAITGQKAGIILPANHVFSYHQPPEVMEVLHRTCQQKQAHLHEINPDNLPSALPLFQQRNWGLAYAVYQYLTERDNLPSLNETQLMHTTKTLIPARMETFFIENKTVILDGAHNSQKLEALTESVKAAYPAQPVAFLISFVRIHERKIKDNLAVLLPHASQVIITGFHDDTAEHYSTDPRTVASQCEHLNYQNYDVMPNPEEALEMLLRCEEQVLVITGSFFLLQHLRPLIMDMHDSSHRRY